MIINVVLVLPIIMYCDFDTTSGSGFTRPVPQVYGGEIIIDVIQPA